MRGSVIGGYLGILAAFQVQDPQDRLRAVSHHRILLSSLHSAPEVYDSESGRHVATLEEDAYLTYVTQMGEYKITSSQEPPSSLLNCWS